MISALMVRFAVSYISAQCLGTLVVHTHSALAKRLHLPLVDKDDVRDQLEVGIHSSCNMQSNACSCRSFILQPLTIGDVSMLDCTARGVRSPSCSAEHCRVQVQYTGAVPGARPRHKGTQGPGSVPKT
jgi:hypothetical protein